MRGYIVSILTIILLLLLSIDTFTFEKIEGKTIYVGMGGYPSIQDAIDNATNGDTIYIANGTYHEHVTIDKTIALIGSSRNSTIIDASYHGTAIKIEALYVQISHLSIRNGGGEKNDALIMIKSPENTIHNCTLAYSRNGILILNNENMVQNCTIQENGGGIIIKNAYKNHIKNCVLYKNGIGIELHSSSGNTIRSINAHTNGMGIYLEESKENMIHSCSIYKNSGNEGGIFLISSDNNAIGNATLHHNVWSIRMVECTGTLISNCSITHSRYGIKMEHCRNNKIQRNNIQHNRYGISLEQCMLEKIEYNNIAENYMYGLYAKLTVANARHNWWNSPFGPHGNGDKLTAIVSKVSHIPWLLEPTSFQELILKREITLRYTNIPILQDPQDPWRSNTQHEDLTDWDPLVDLHLSVHIIRIRNTELKNNSLYASVDINENKKESDIWKGYDIKPHWKTTQDIPDDKENIPLQIQIWEKGLKKNLCLEIPLIYNMERGEWYGHDYLGDKDGYGYVFEENYELWFDVTFNDYDHDGLTYWEETRLYHTDPQINDSGEDFDNDTVPIEWEDTWGYDPFIYDDHPHLDPDNDGIENTEEWETSQWHSDPYRKDIFIEVDHMAAKNTFRKPYSLPEKSKQMLYTAFTLHNIIVHIDDGSMGEGEEIPYKEKITYNETKNMYWRYFLQNNTQNPRKGVFHYALLCAYGATPRGGHAFQAWDNLDMFMLAVQYIRDWRLMGKERDITTASLFMHELGHTLGLFESVFDGIDNESCNDPWHKGWWIYSNYRSCLNYRYSFSLVDYSDGIHGRNDYNDWENLDLTFFQNSFYYTS